MTVARGLCMGSLAGLVLAAGGLVLASAPPSDGGDLDRPRPSPGSDLVPGLVLQAPDSGPPVIVVGTDDNELFEVSPQSGSRVDPFYVAIGKQGADKQVEGDERTPIGIYRVQRFIPGRQLPEIYGVGAFPISYPNAWDRHRKRTGSGIWIHGTNKTDDELLPRSSRGCLTLRNADFESLAERVEIQDSMVVIGRKVPWISKAELGALRAELLDVVETWRSDWESLDTNRYLAHYSSDFRSDGMDISRWAEHKRRVNRRKSWIKVDLSEISAYRYPGEEETFVVSFRQDYASDNYSSSRTKSQFWRREAGVLRIVLESNRI